MEYKTLVGIPLYTGESDETIKDCLDNLLYCLSYFDFPVEIVLALNGKYNLGRRFNEVEKILTKYPANIKLIKTDVGIVNAEKTIAKIALKKRYNKIFFTDVDIYRFPKALRNLWDLSKKPVSGCNYCTYPNPILDKSGIKLTVSERVLLSIFEADKHPYLISETKKVRDKKRLKGSLILIETGLVGSVFGKQKVTTDSIMNLLVPDSDREVIESACFMYFGRTNLVDHITARLRHFRAANEVGKLERFSSQSLIYTPQVANKIANNVRSTVPQSQTFVTYFLLQCALRMKVIEICRAVLGGHNIASIKSPNVKFDAVNNFDNALDYINKKLFANFDINTLNSKTSFGIGTTNNKTARKIIKKEIMLDEVSLYIAKAYLNLHPSIFI